MLVGNPLERFFGKSQNGKIAELLARQAEIASSCAELLLKSKCAALPEIVAFEHEGDMTEQRIHEILDSAFILRFDKSDIANLASALDNLVDGMRHAATHVETFAPYLRELRGEALELLEKIADMTATVERLAQLLAERRGELARVKEYTRYLVKCEAQADVILHKAESALVREQGKHADALTFLAHSRLVAMLERITDTANHCGTLILSIARKEA